LERRPGPLNAGRTDEERVALVTALLDEAGITAPLAREPLAEVEIHEVRLVAWMAVRARGVAAWSRSRAFMRSMSAD